MAKDLEDWSKWWNIPLLWPSTFPIRTVTALRVAIVEPKTIPLLCNYLIFFVNFLLIF